MYNAAELMWPSSQHCVDCLISCEGDRSVVDVLLATFKKNLLNY